MSFFRLCRNPLSVLINGAFSCLEAPGWFLSAPPAFSWKCAFFFFFFLLSLRIKLFSKRCSKGKPREITRGTLSLKLYINSLNVCAFFHSINDKMSLWIWNCVSVDVLKLSACTCNTNILILSAVAFIQVWQNLKCFYFWLSLLDTDFFFLNKMLPTWIDMSVHRKKWSLDKCH